MDNIQKLKFGSKEDIQNVFREMDTKLLKTLLNGILNVLENDYFEQRITPSYRTKLKPYMGIYKQLLNKKIPLKQKLLILQKSGHKYIPTFLKILGDSVYECIPEGSTKRRRRDCPICGKTDLVRLSNHLSQKHNISGSEKKRILQESKNASDKYNDTRDEVSSEDRERSSDESDY